MPTYAKFLKDILSNKRSLGGRETVKLTEQCSAVLSSELPPKLEDPGKFSIPCQIGKATIQRALCDLGASVSLMPRSIFERMGVGVLKPTRMTLQLADASVRVPLGIVEDVPILVGKFYLPVDFIVMEMEEDKDIPVILGRSFLKTARTLIDVENGTLTLRIGDEKVQFSINRAMKYPSEPAIPETCYAMDGVDKSVDDLTHGPRAYQHTVRAPQPAKLTIAHKAATREEHGLDLLRTDRVLAQSEQPPPEPDTHPTNIIPHGPYHCHTFRTPQKWMLLPDPPDPHSANQ